MAKKTTAPKSPASTRTARIDQLFRPELVASLAATQDTDPYTVQLPGGARLMWVDVDDTEDNPHQIREVYHEEDIADIAQSFNAIGQMQPAIARPKRALDGSEIAGKYQLAIGHQRKMAVKKGFGNAGSNLPNPQNYIGKLWVIVKTLSDAEMLMLVIEENERRSDPDLIARAKGFEKLKKLSGAWKAVEAKTELTYRRMNQITSLLDLPLEMQNAIATGAMNERHGRALLRLSKEPKQQELLFRQIGREQLSGTQADKRVGELLATHTSARQMKMREIARDLDEKGGAGQGGTSGGSGGSGGSSSSTVPKLSIVPKTSTAMEPPPLAPSVSPDAASEVAAAQAAAAAVSVESTPQPVYATGRLEAIAGELDKIAQELKSLNVSEIRGGESYNMEFIDRHLKTIKAETTRVKNEISTAEKVYS